MNLQTKPGESSQRRMHEVLAHPEQAVVPEQDYEVAGYLLRSLHTQLHYILKVPIDDGKSGEDHLLHSRKESADHAARFRGRAQTRCWRDCQPFHWQSLGCWKTPSEGKAGTYCLPVGSFRGLMSSFLKAAKNSSTGEAEYECGPVKMIGNACRS